MRSRLKVMAGRLLLTAIAAAGTLLLCELLLRTFYPKFKFAAESNYTASNTRIWSRNPGTRYVRANPDTGTTHLVCHNNLGLRQHRDFTPAALAGAANIAVFGDSFVENLRLPVQFSFTEPLDYLLNGDGLPINVLNLGVDGYGTDQCYLAWREFPSRRELRHVVYVFCANDVRNIQENQLFSVDDRGRLLQRPAQQPSWPVRCLSRFHLTYLVIETIEAVFYHSGDRNKRVDLASFLEHARHYRSAQAEKVQEDLVNQRASPLLEENLRRMFAILRTWRDEVRATGAEFHIVLLPRVAEHRAASLFIEAGFPVIDLYRFDHPAADEAERHELFFTRDGHWNERGNELAAIALYRQLSRQPAARPEIDRRLGLYYSAMGSPKLPDGAVPPIPPTPSEAAAIRQKYRSLE